MPICKAFLGFKIVVLGQEYEIISVNNNANQKQLGAVKKGRCQVK